MSSDNQQESSPVNKESKETSGKKTQNDAYAVSRMSEEEIDYNVMGSFPASDPPSWTLGIRPRKKESHKFEGEKPSAKDPTHQNESVWVKRRSSEETDTGK